MQIFTVSIIQLSTANQAYIVDISVIKYNNDKKKKEIYYVALSKFLNSIFNNVLPLEKASDDVGIDIGVVLIGFGLKNDYKRLKEVFDNYRFMNNNTKARVLRTDDEQKGNYNGIMLHNAAVGSTSNGQIKSLPDINELRHVYDFSLPPINIDMMLEDPNYIRNLSNSVVILCKDTKDVKTRNEMVQAKVIKIVDMLFENNEMIQKMYVRTANL